jgi:preprotein translocase subunit SecA
MNRHRRATYAMRKDILRSNDIGKRIRIFIQDEVHMVANSPLLLTDQLESVVTEVFPLDEPTLDRLFSAPAERFGKVLLAAARELYEAREEVFTDEIMRKVERDVYLQILDNLWMQHLENMDHLREGIHWMSVGQRDPLVEYRRQGQHLFEEMQTTLRHEVVRALFHAQPIDPSQLEAPIETELTRAARQSISNANNITDAEVEFTQEDFKNKKAADAAKKANAAVNRKKVHKTERKRKSQARKRK